MRKEFPPSRAFTASAAEDRHLLLSGLYNTLEDSSIVFRKKHREIQGFQKHTLTESMQFAMHIMWIGKKIHPLQG